MTQFSPFSFVILSMVQTLPKQTGIVPFCSLAHKGGMHLNGHGIYYCLLHCLALFWYKINAKKKKKQKKIIMRSSINTHGVVPICLVLCLVLSGTQGRQSSL